MNLLSSAIQPLLGHVVEMFKIVTTKTAVKILPELPFERY